MLEDLRIKNFALIDSASVEFKNGFTVLSGETGAGKSLLIGALTFLLGGKGGVEHISLKFRGSSNQRLINVKKSLATGEVVELHLTKDNPTPVL